MLLDLTRLHQRSNDSWKPCADKVMTSPSDFAGHTLDSSGPFIGRLELGDAARQSALQIDGSVVERIRVAVGLAQVDVRVPSPVPGYRNSDALHFAVVRKSVATAWEVQSVALGWFKSSAGITGELNEALRQAGSSDIKLAVGNSHAGKYEAFPLHQLGVAMSPGYWTRSPINCRGWLGLLRATADASSSMALFIPTGYHDNPALDAVEGLKLFGLTGTRLGRDNAFSMMPIVLARPLSRPEGTWRVLTQWQPVLPQGTPLRVNRLRLRQFADAAWNDPVRATMQGVHLQSAGAPLVPTPTINLQFDETNDDAPAAVPLLVFDVPRPASPADAGSAQARLRHIHFLSTVSTTVIGSLQWQSGGVGFAAGGMKPPAHLAGATLQFKAKMPQSALQPWTTLPSSEHLLTMARRVADACAPLDSAASADLLMDLPLKDAEVTSASGEWIRFGSLEILPGRKADLRLRLRGTWTEATCDLYPESDVVLLDCRARVSSGSDAAGRDQRARFDVQDSAEDALQRETDPLRYPLKDDPGRPCRIRVRHLARPGRMAASRVEIFSTTGGSDFGVESLNLQIRPFSVAMVKPAAIDPSAGELIAVWSSDDPEGQQWRVPDQTIECTLPPQAVGEAMERGVRFWTEAGGLPSPVVDPTKPLKYRFSPPTRLTARPSVRERRYNTSPTNLAAALNGSKVDSFVTELAYPVQAEFRTSNVAIDIRIQETAAYFGAPALAFALSPARAGDHPDEVARWRPELRAVMEGDMADEMAYYASLRPDRDLIALADARDALRRRHAAFWSMFVARIAQYHVHDPFRPDGSLHLTQGLRFRIRDTSHGAPPLANPLPGWMLEYTGTGTKPTFNAVRNPVDLARSQKEAIHGDGDSQPKFLDAARGKDWGVGGDSIAAGVVHTIEFPSELVAVLRNPTSETGSIDTLAWTALGATGSFQCSFDEGRTTFIVESRHGQLSRLLKVRIGRVAVLWNRARHTVVYSRTTAPSEQFEEEQELGAPRSRGWPMLRKTEEYVEPIDTVRSFDVAADAKSGSSTGFVAASEFVSPRIYVNGAWGRDLGHGYEIPLWNDADTSGFYPKPVLALQVRGGGADRARCVHDAPQHLYFYSNTEPGTGGDPDAWAAKRGLDCPRAMARLPVVTSPRVPTAADIRETLTQAALPAPRLGGTSRPRFDFKVTSDGKANLQHGRGETEMLSTLQVISLARTSAIGPQDELLGGLKPKWDQVAARCQEASQIDVLHEIEARANAALARGMQALLGAPQDCVALKEQMTKEIVGVFATVKEKLATAPPFIGAAPKLATTVLDRIKGELGDYERMLSAPFESLRGDLARAQGAVTDDFASLLPAVKAQLANGRARIDQAFELASSRLSDMLTRLDTAQAGVGSAGDRVAVVIDATLAIVADYLTELGKAQPDVAKLRGHLAGAKQQLDRLTSHASLGAAAKRLGDVVMAADHCLVVEAAIQKEIVASLQGALVFVGKGLDEALKGARAMCLATIDAVRQVVLKLEAVRKDIAKRLKDHLDELQAATQAKLAAALSHAMDTVNAFSAAAGATADQLQQSVLRVWRLAVEDLVEQLRQTVAKPFDDSLATLFGHAATLASKAAKLLDAASGAATDWLARAQAEALKAIDSIDCAALQGTVEKAEAAARAALRQAEQQIRERVTGLASALVDDDVRSRLDELEGDLAAAGHFADVASSGIKLVKAIGEVPALPHLDFNTALAEMSFDDVKKQIETSAFAAKLREIDSGLTDLGLAVPARRLLDQIVPDELKELDFNKVFRKFGGIDFKEFFQRFRLPKLESDAVRIAHGVDKATRSAWVKADVDVDFPEENTLFEFSALGVRIAKMQLQAHTDARIGLGGERQSSTDARLKGDWGLDFSGTRLATFRDVTVRYDGSRFDFDISPDKVELHPSVKFVSDIAKQFTPDLPPAVELLKDARGVPVGAKASMTQFLTLPPLGAVEIGPLLIASGLSLQVQNTGRFVVSTHVSVGSQKAPVWVQIGYLGGGLWLEAKATYQDKVTYSASLGLAVGSAKSLNIAGVARGSYSLLLFAYAEINNSGGTLRAGFSMAGSARILGIANASVYLLLEVVYRGGGEADGHGVLDVEIDICWCYSIHVRTEVQQKIGG